MEHFEDHHKQEFDHSALEVERGVSQPPIVNPYYRKHPRRKLTTEQYVEGILRRDITILSQAITLVESLLPEHHDQAQEIIERCLPHAAQSVRIGITGVPGAGKSTFIEAIGNTITALGHRLCVLAIDPSSERTGGSILGDKTRMETLVHNPDAFIRPSPTAGSLGGVARKTRESVVLCEAAGFDVIFIETVGVGQSETAVHSMVDLFLMLQISGAGDELQGIKRGIMEMADLVAITKADGSNIERAELARSHIRNALNLFPMPASGWKPRVYTTSSREKRGLTELWGGIEDYLRFTKENGYFTERRNQQVRYWMYETINETLRDSFYHNEAVKAHIEATEQAVLARRKTSFVGAKELLDIYFNR
ncbi:MAG: methylmalonyl Co-A mutase-associated GTPase MeaB [Rikenellaceae bacterium]|nr:methylmalonyl Co-A mutase-associated GTPase MeaB [Rikenellaceae bacterium]